MTSTHCSRLTHVQHMTEVAINLVLMAIACVACLAITILSLTSTAFFKVEGLSQIAPWHSGITEHLDIHQGMPSLRLILGIIAAAVVLFTVSWLLQRVPARHIGTVLVTFALMASLLWVLSLNAQGSVFWYNDTRSLSDSAQALLDGNIAEFAPGAKGHGDGVPSFYDYYSWYPFQTGAMLWFALVYSLTGAGNILGFQVINAFLTAGIVWIIWRIGILCGLPERALRCEALLLALCLPLFMMSAFVYTNTAGVFFALLAAMLALESMRNDSLSKAILLACAAFFTIAMAMLIKGTVVIFAIAMVVALSINALRRGCAWLILIHLTLFVAACKLSSVSVPIVEHLVKQQFGPGLPQTSWIAIGLSEGSANTNPGWWTPSAINTYNSTAGDPALQSNAAWASIITALSGFLHDPASGWSFFMSKLTTEWAEPTFQTLHYSALVPTTQPGRLAEAAFTPPLYERIIAFGNLYQTLVYIFATVGIVLAMRRHNRDCLPQLAFVALCFLGGFGCFLFWEAKSIYILPFMVMLIPLAAFGLDQALTPLGHATRRLMNDRLCPTVQKLLKSSSQR